MARYKLALCVVLILFTSLISLKCIAVFVPDFLTVGSNPEIAAIEPPYFISGEKVKITGKNFFEFPTKANKLFINNRPVRVISSKGGYIEFIVPKLPLGEAKVKFYTKYLGYKSNEVNYPNETETYIPVTFHGPKINSVNSYSVNKQDEILINGDFETNALLYFEIKNEEIQATVISNKFCKLQLPHDLPKGIFKIKAYYKKKINKIDAYFRSQESSTLTLYNSSLGNPFAVRLVLERSRFDSLDLYSDYKVLLYFNSGEIVDVTEFSEVKLLNNEFFELNPSERRIKSKKRGSSILEGRLMWLPTKQEFFDSQVLSIETPIAPTFQEVIINEVFPFANPQIKETDANMNGFAKTKEDEFIEFKNLTKEKLDIAGCLLFTGESTIPQYEFPTTSVIEPFSFITIFGNQVNNGKLDLSDSGGSVELLCNKVTIDYIAYPKGKSGDSSWIRKNDLSAFEKHGVILFSPNEENLQTPQSLDINLPNVLDIDSQSEIGTLRLKELNIFPNILQFTSKEPKQIKVVALFDNGETKEVTNEASYKISGIKDIIKIDSNGLITPLMNGEVTLNVYYFEKEIELSVGVNVVSLVQPRQLIINEILAAPNSDVNKDNLFKSDQDEFIEVVNVSGNSLDISGLLVSDSQKVRHLILEGTILENLEPLVIFGGGDLNNFSQNIKTQQSTTGSLGLNNNGTERVTISTSDGRIINELSIDNANLQGVSLNRAKDLSFEDSLITHDKFLKSVGKFSPGTRINGSLFILQPQEGAFELKGSSSSSSSGAINLLSSGGALQSSSSSSGSFATSSSSSSSGSSLDVSSSSSSSGCLQLPN